jgi:hypothetical protein
VCIVGTNEWRIDDEFLSNGKESWYFDGSDVFHSVRQTSEGSSEANQIYAVVPFEQVKSNITIYIRPSPGGHPQGALGVNVPWLAYCSGNFLKQRGRVIPLPTAVYSDPGATGYSDKTEVFTDELGLPKQIDLFTSRAEYLKSLSDGRLVRWPERVHETPLVQPRYPDGVLKYHYEVEATTNFSGWIFPSRFNYVTYDIDRSGTNELRVGGVGRLLSIHESPKPENVFRPDLHQTIIRR